MSGTWAGVRDFVSTSPAETERWGSLLGRYLLPGAVLDLRGPLGAGKTQFVRGVARALGVTSQVRSPTFTICHVHEGRIPLYHIDAYRIQDPGDLLLQGWDEMRARGVVAVEWGDLVEELLEPDRIQVSIDHRAAGERRLQMAVGNPALWKQLSAESE